MTWLLNPLFRAANSTKPRNAMTNKEKSIVAEINVAADLKDVWDAWTTEKGVKSFFAPECKVDLRPDGMYEIYFNPDAPPGSRGGEGLRIMSIQPPQMLSFTWNAPPNLPNVREQRTHVVIRLFPEEGGTKVTLYHDGWGTGREWDEACTYFQNAWGQIVLPRLKYRFIHGPIDWKNPPTIEALAREKP